MSSKKAKKIRIHDFLLKAITLKICNIFLSLYVAVSGSIYFQKLIRGSEKVLSRFIQNGRC